MSKETRSPGGTLLRGALDLLVLRVLSRGRQHGFGITRFTEEWNFLREAVISEFESRGYGKREARIAAAQRMGARFRYRREALGAIGGNWQGLLSLLPIRSTARSPFLAPIALILGPVMTLALNPQRVMAVRCIDAMLLFRDLPAIDRIDGS